MHLQLICFQRYNRTINFAAYFSHQSQFAPVQQWYSDSGATHHITSDLSSRQYAKEYKGPDLVHEENGQGFPIHHTGKSFISSPKILTLNDIFHAPLIAKPLFLFRSSPQTIMRSLNFIHLTSLLRIEHLRHNFFQAGVMVTSTCFLSNQLHRLSNL